MSHTSRRRRSAVLGVALAGALTASMLAAQASSAAGDDSGGRAPAAAGTRTGHGHGHGLPYLNASAARSGPAQSTTCSAA